MSVALPNSVKDIEEIQKLIGAHIIRTPVIESEIINEMTQSRVFFKCENFQRIGAFKARGALNAVLRLSKDELAKGVATHSSGNHAQALAYAAKIAGTKAIIVMPENSNKTKIEGVKRLGGEIIFCKPTTEDREKKLEEYLKKSGSFYVPPYNHEWVIGGQGTAAKELLEDHPEIELMLTPTGGGGLLSGTALVSKLVNNKINVFGAEPENLNDAKRSFISGGIEKNEIGKSSVADGLRTTLGEITLKCILENVSDIFTVTEEEIIQSMKLMWQYLKITAEPSCAVTLAAVLKNPTLFKQKITGIIVSGGNVDLEEVPFLK